eukprot:scaffold17827_cov26-Cyclotella_meneghiniana.AAC.1
MKWCGVEFGDSVRVAKDTANQLTQKYYFCTYHYPEGVRVRAGKYGADVMKYAGQTDRRLMAKFDGCGTTGAVPTVSTINRSS